MANKVTMTICGQEYTLVADESAAYMEQVGTLVNQRMRDEHGDYMVKLDLGGESYCKPASWMDCYLGK